MKNYLLIATLFICSCGSNNQEQTMTEKTMEAAGTVTASNPDTLCFYRTAGTTNQDTGLVQLVILKNSITGKVMNLPHQKDSRVGRISGTKDGDIITAQWTYMQEGMIDSVAVAFRMEGSTLLQKSPSYDPQTGREVLPDTATYRIRFTQTDCGNVGMLEYDLSRIGL